MGRLVPLVWEALPEAALSKFQDLNDTSTNSNYQEMESNKKEDKNICLASLNTRTEREGAIGETY